MLLLYVWCRLESHFFSSPTSLCSVTFRCPLIFFHFCSYIFAFPLFHSTHNHGWCCSVPVLLLWRFSSSSSSLLLLYSTSLCWALCPLLPKTLPPHLVPHFTCSVVELRGSFFLFALFHFSCRAVVRSAAAPSPRPRGPARHAAAADSCPRPPPRLDPT